MPRSTAVPDIWAKNIVDILLEVGSEDDLDNVEKWLLPKDWRCMSRSAHRVSMNKGYIVNADDKCYNISLYEA